MMSTARAVATGHDLIGQLHGVATHVGPNALLRSSSYPLPTTAPGSGPLRNPALPSGTWFQLNGATEFQPTVSDAHAGLAYDNWASGPTTVYAYNNNPANHGGIVPSGGLKIDGFEVAAGAYVFQFLDLSSANEVELESGVASGGVVFRGCRFRNYTDGSDGCFIEADPGYTSPLLILYCDLGGKGNNVTSQYSNDSIQDLATTSLVVYRCYFSLHGTAIQPNGSSPASSGPCDILENYMEKWLYNSGDHDNGISASGDGWSCFRWQRNYIVIEAEDANGQALTETDCISIGSDHSVDNVGTGTNPDGTTGFQITHNYCAGGDYSYYLSYDGTNTVSGVNFSHNLISASQWPAGGNLGAVADAPLWMGTSPPNIQSNNLWADGAQAGQSFFTAPIVFGVTVDDIANLSGIMTSLNALITATGVKPTVRVYFDVLNAASVYTTAVSEIHAVAYVMGELLDSADEASITTAAYSTRVSSYLSTLGPYVDIWEIGNEVNGDWTENGSSSWDGTYTTVVAKLTEAYDLVTAAGGQTALTLYANYSAGDSEDGHTELSPEAFSAQVPEYVRNGLNYVLLSYYEEDNGNVRPSAATWGGHFAALHALYPNAWQGFGEVGQDAVAGSGAHLTTGEGIADYYYNLAPTVGGVLLPYYCGGYFWWYYAEDCVPSSKAMFSHITGGFTAEAAALG